MKKILSSLIGFILPFLVLFVLIALFVLAFNASTSQNNSEYPGPGRDTRLIFESGKFQIGDVAGDVCLEMYYPNDSRIYPLLSDVSKYKKIGDTLYVDARTGYAVVDGKTDTCKVLLYEYHDALSSANPNMHPEITSSDSWNHDGAYYALPDIYNDPALTYIFSFSDFTAAEQKVLKSLG